MVLAPGCESVYPAANEENLEATAVALVTEGRAL